MKMEHETLWTLLKDPAHIELELLLIFIFDGVIGLVLWPLIKKHLGRWQTHHRGDDAAIEELQQQVKELQIKVGIKKE